MASIARRLRFVLPARVAAAGLCAGACLVATTASAATQVVSPPSDDTFINSIDPGNNNGGSNSFFTGTDGHGGNMRALIRFDMPAGLQGRVTITRVQLSLTVEAFPMGNAGTPATESLQAVTQAWIQGNGVGDAQLTFTVGQACSGSVVGATWDQTNCATSTNWTTAGGTVGSTISGQVDTTGIPAGGLATFDSANNAGMNADVQSWIDSPATNFGWRITSSTENMNQSAQRFDSTEAGPSTAPTLTITYTCNPPFQASGNACVASTSSVPAMGSATTGLLALLLGAAALLGLRGRSPTGPVR